MRLSASTRLARRPHRLSLRKISLPRQMSDLTMDAAHKTDIGMSRRHCLTIRALEKTRRHTA